jgi:hypothetical protein
MAYCSASLVSAGRTTFRITGAARRAAWRPTCPTARAVLDLTKPLTKNLAALNMLPSSSFGCYRWTAADMGSWSKCRSSSREKKEERFAPARTEKDFGSKKS